MKTLPSLVSAVFLLLVLSNVYAATSPETVDGAQTIDAKKAKSLYDGGTLFIDVRSDKDWKAGHITNAKHIELKKSFSSSSLAKQAKKDDVIVFYCNGESCLRSSKASAKAVAWGYSKIHYFRLGYPAWKAAGYNTQ